MDSVQRIVGYNKTHSKQQKRGVTLNYLCASGRYDFIGRSGCIARQAAIVGRHFQDEAT